MPDSGLCSSVRNLQIVPGDLCCIAKNPEECRQSVGNCGQRINWQRRAKSPHKSRRSDQCFCLLKSRTLPLGHPLPGHLQRPLPRWPSTFAPTSLSQFSHFHLVYSFSQQFACGRCAGSAGRGSLPTLGICHAFHPSDDLEPLNCSRLC